MIADIGAGGVGDLGRKICLCESLHTGLQGQTAEIGGGAAGHDGLVNRLTASVVGNAGVVQIDCHPLQPYLVATACLAQAQHQRWQWPAEKIKQPSAGHTELCRQAVGCDGSPRQDLSVQCLHDQRTGVQALMLAESVKAGDQDLACQAQTSPRIRARWLACERLLTFMRRNRRQRWTLTVCSLILSSSAMSRLLRPRSSMISNCF